MPRNIRRYPHAAYLLAVYGLSILCFTGFRVLLLSLHQKDIFHFGMERHRLVAEAFVMGFRFDTVIACYLLSPPLIVLGIFAVGGWLRPLLLRLGYLYAGISFSAAFLLCAADIPFYNHFFRRLDDGVFAWKAHTAFSIKMIAQEPALYLFALLAIVAAMLYCFVLRRICRSHVASLRVMVSERPHRPSYYYAPVLILLIGAFVLGVRGRTSAKTPILAGAAYICDDPTINALGLNPVFTLIRTAMDAGQPENARLHWISDGEALRATAIMLHADSSFQSISPIARKAVPSGALRGRNVVLIIMESMSTAKMARYGSAENLTPFLDSLAGAAWSFDNIWSAGIHTYNGIYSTLFAHPALMGRHPMEVVSVPQIAGLPHMLKMQGWNTLFFTTHDELFDNMSGFLSANGVDKIIGQKDYPSREVRSTMGVPDEYMFRYSMKVLNDAGAKAQPFFAAFMTGSDHDPIIIPEGVGFTPRHSVNEPYKQSVEYADWSLRRFMEYASAQPWYDNTLFVLVADHGCIWGHNSYDVAFSYQHIPLVLFAPGFTTGKAFPQLGLQTDVAATVMGLVGKTSLLNNTFSTNLLAERKPYAIFSADNHLACMDDSLLYVWRAGHAKQSLYRYRGEDLTDYWDSDSVRALTMRKAAFSWLQTSQWMIEQKKAR